MIKNVNDIHREYSTLVVFSAFHFWMALSNVRRNFFSNFIKCMRQFSQILTFNQ